MMRAARAGSLAWLGAMVIACGGARSDVHAQGSSACHVEVLRDEASARPVRRIGIAVARCRGENATEERCMPQLRARACELGATVVWQLQSSVMLDGDGLELRAEAGAYR